MFKRVGYLRKGYNVEEVNSYFEEARRFYEEGVGKLTPDSILQKVFSLQRNGYDEDEVDSALDRLIDALTNQERADYVTHNGQQSWLDKVSVRAATLYPRLLRPLGERFEHPRRSQAGYKVEQVDAFLDNISAFFNEGRDLTAREVRSVVFETAYGKRAYDERVVDAYLNRVLEVMLAVE
ncbi:DivIVA domain-containing protein [Actinomycetaceae bacterium TAE3-ERU4]|nr:DivIVA domain-containing protein [Actinomycetaceae bacterium TAE3-ERU4]